MISYGFPPAGGSGVQRSAKFAKYLPEFGWRPTVWSCTWPRALPRDDSLLAELPDDLDIQFRDALDTSYWSKTAGDAASALVRWVSGREEWGRKAAWRMDKLVRGALRSLLVPDEQILWALSSLGSLRNLIYRRRIDVIYSTYSPTANHLLGWLLKRATHRPWVADNRDLWTREYRYRFAEGPRWRLAIDRHLEQRFLEDADAVIGIGPSHTRILADLVPHQREKFVTITNGVDLDDFNGIEKTGSNGSKSSGRLERDRMVLAYVGRFTGECITPPVLEGLSRFGRWLGDRKDRFELRLVGQISGPLLPKLDDLPIRWTQRGYVAHREAINEMVSADCLLLAINDGLGCDTILTGKVFEYLASGTPVLMVGPKRSDARDLIENCQAGVTVELDAASICETLKLLWQQWSANELPPGCPPDRLQPYTRRNLTERLSEVLDGAIAKSRSARPPASPTPSPAYG